jgi:hypothetical protein
MDECDREYPPQNYIKRILCYCLQCNEKENLALGDEDVHVAEKPVADGPNTDEGSVTCDDIDLR